MFNAQGLTQVGEEVFPLVTGSGNSEDIDTLGPAPQLLFVPVRPETSEAGIERSGPPSEDSICPESQKMSLLSGVNTMVPPLTSASSDEPCVTTALSRPPSLFYPC